MKKNMTGCALLAMRAISGAMSTGSAQVSLDAASQLYGQGAISGRDIALIRAHARRKINRLLEPKESAVE